MNAPTKHRSTNATKSADLLVEPNRTSVASAQAAARTDTMNRTRMKDGVNLLDLLKPSTNHDCIVLAQIQLNRKLGIRTSMPMMGMRVISWKIRHEANKKPPNILLKVATC